MLIRVLFYILTLWLIEPQTIEPKVKRAFATKKGIRDYNHAIPVGTSNFKDLVKYSKQFVDNSLFIQDVLESDDSKLFLLCPRQWGKTTNLDMFRTFFEIEVDNEGNRIPQECASNYKLFAEGVVAMDNGTTQYLQSPFLIAANKAIVQQYQGQYPVINVTFKDATGDDLETVTNQVRVAICRAFKEHEYLSHVVPRAAADAANNISRALTDTEQRLLKAHLECDSSIKIEEGIRFLAQLLHSRFKQKVVVLLDDFDVPIHNYLRVANFRKDDTTQILRLMENVARYTTDLNFHYHRVIVFGTYQLSQALYAYFGSFGSYLTHHVALRNHPLHDYFGFSRSQIKELYDKHHINRYLSDKATQWYDGYESNASNEHYYSPVSIIHFLNRKKITIYKRSEKNNYIKNVLARQPTIRKALFDMISQNEQNISAAIAASEKIGGKDEINNLKRLSTHSTPPQQWQISIFLLYLLTEGYLTVASNTSITRLPVDTILATSKSTNLPNLCQVKLPNIETTYMLSNWLVSYYQKRFDIPEELLQKAAGELFDFLTEEFVETTGLENTLQTLYEASASILQAEGSLEDISNKTKENPIRYILNCVMLRAQCLSQFEILTYYNGLRKADFLTIHNRSAQGVIMQMSYNTSLPSLALDVAEKRRYLLQKRKYIDKMKFVAINIAPDYTVTAKARLMIRERLLDQRIDPKQFILKECL